jgi:hypothetical protein
MAIAYDDTKVAQLLNGTRAWPTGTSPTRFFNCVAIYVDTPDEDGRWISKVKLAAVRTYGFRFSAI